MDNAQMAPQGAPQPGAQPRGNRVQEIAQRLLQAAQQIVYHKNSVQQILQIVRQAKDPVEGIVQATMLVIHHLMHQIKGIDPKVTYFIAPKVALMIAELCVKAKIIPDDSKLMQKVMAELKNAIAQHMQQSVQNPPQSVQNPSPPKPAALLAGAMVH